MKTMMMALILTVGAYVPAASAWTMNCVGDNVSLAIEGVGPVTKKITGRIRSDIVVQAGNWTRRDVIRGRETLVAQSGNGQQSLKVSFFDPASLKAVVLRNSGTGYLSINDNGWTESEPISCSVKF